MSSRASVDLPQPDSPTTPSVSPRASSKEMPSTARIVPPRDGKCFTRCSARRSGNEHLPREVAGGGAPASDGHSGGVGGTGDVPGGPAPGVEGATGREVREVGGRAHEPRGGHPG